MPVSPRGERGRPARSIQLSLTVGGGGARLLLPGAWAVVVGFHLLAGGSGALAGDGIREIYLADVIRSTFDANPEVKVRALDVSISGEEIEKAKALFDPVFEFETNLQYGRRPSAFSTARPRGDETTAFADALLTKKTVLGTTIDIEANYLLSRGDDGGVLLNPLHQSQVSLTLIQPLLRGAGIFVNRLPIVLARTGKEIAWSRFLDTVMTEMAAAEAAYWEWGLRYRNVVDEAEVLKAAEQFAADAAVRFEAGDFSEVDVMEARRVALARRVRMIEFENARIRAEAKLKGLMNEPEAVGESVRWVPGDQPRLQDVSFSLVDEIVRGLHARPSFQAAKKDLEKQEISVEVARNALLPVLSLVGGVAFEGISGGGRDRVDSEGNRLVSPYVGSATDLFSRMTSGDGTRWNVGVIVSFPWGSRAEKATYRQRKIVAAQAFERLVRAERTVIREVRTAVAIIGNNAKRCRVATETRMLSEGLVAKVRESVKVGNGTARDMAEALEDLAQANSDENLALGAFVDSLTELERANGTLLLNRGLSLDRAFARTER